MARTGLDVDTRTLLQLAVNGVRLACPDATGWLATALPDQSHTASEAWPRCVPVSTFHPDPLTSWWWPRSRVTLVGVVDTRNELPERWIDHLPGGTPLWWQPQSLAH